MVEAGQFTKIDNGVMDALARLDASGADIKIILTILRATDGWHKELDKLPISQIAKLTELDRTTVAKRLSLLQQRHIVIRSGRMVGINKDIGLWDARINGGETAVKSNRVEAL